jgi:cystathionine beta-lyase/cystathionine gamma-synthase
MRPLDHGADVVMHSLTKYYNRHGDAMGGVVIGDRDLVEDVRTGAMWHAGGVMSFALPGSHQDRLRFVNDLRLITSAVSLGHDETLGRRLAPERRTSA